MSVSKSVLRNIQHSGIALLALVLVFALGAGVSGTAQAEETGGNCSHGYWKNHEEAWVTYNTTDVFDTVFGLPYFGDGRTLIQTLNTGGGSKNAVGRHAVAVLLNSEAYGTEPDLAGIMDILNNNGPSAAAFLLEAAIFMCEGGQGPQGKPGEQGPQGKIGETGAQGPQGKLGAQGAQGKQGPQGSQGKIGETGPQGAQGEQGPQGKVGETGSTGPQGPQGKIGETGGTGPQGPQGKIGETGPAGAQGEQGPQGKAGETGATGPQGPQGKVGETGATGPQGPQGKIGETGATGPQGPQGKIGETGATGAQGPQGKVGETGATGPQGPQGKVGETGATGAQGPQGKIGETGATGAQGPQGKIGETGAQGPQGKIGATGAQGPQGKVGATGSQGPQGKMGMTGAQGAQGKQGEAGAQGPQGKVGAQGPQGKQGPAGEDGEDSTGTFLCFSTDQTIGNQGKTVGLGTQDNLHSKVSIVLPLAVIVESFTVKAGQGNTPKDGDAQLFKDGATSAGQLVTNDVCELNSSPSDIATTCTVNITDPCTNAALSAGDSLSVFIKTDSGNFEGMSACAVVRSQQACP
jgi:hypothetical protein